MLDSVTATLQKIQGITEFIDPGETIAENETVVGEMNEEQKKVYSYIAGPGKDNRLEAMLHPTPEILRQAHLDALIRDLLFFNVNDSLKLWDHHGVGFRVGFKIVVFDGEA